MPPLSENNMKCNIKNIGVRYDSKITLINPLLVLIKQKQHINTDTHTIRNARYSKAPTEHLHCTTAPLNKPLAEGDVETLGTALGQCGRESPGLQFRE